MNPETHLGANKACGLLFSEQPFIASKVARITGAPLWWVKGYHGDRGEGWDVQSNVTVWCYVVNESG